MPKRIPVLHPFLIALYPVLFIYSNNIGRFYLTDVIKPALLILIATLLCLYGFQVIIKNYRKSGLMLSLSLFLFFSYGHLEIIFGKAGILWLAAVSAIMMLATGILIVIRLKGPMDGSTRALNLMAGILVLFPIIKIVFSPSASSVVFPSREPGVEQKEFTNKTQTVLPDIYCIVLDAYARSDVLSELYGYDNSDFLTYLSEKRFYVAKKSAANYNQTGLSMASFFNYNYINGLLEQRIGRDSRDRKVLKELIENSLAIQYLKKRGYSTVTFSTGCFETDLTNMDVYLQPVTTVNVFLNELLNQTPVPDITAYIKGGSMVDNYRLIVMNTIDNLGNLHRLTPNPKLVFAHIEIPHPPFVFDADGEPVLYEAKYSPHDGDWLIRPGRLTVEAYKKYYVDQLRFVNSRMKTIVDNILARSVKPPVILIFGDHGPRSGTHWEDADKTNMKECLANLSAYYLPDGGEEFLYPEITPVNIFRVVLNHYYGEDLKLLPDKNYFSPAKFLYHFSDVTNRVKREITSAVQ